MDGLFGVDGVCMWGGYVSMWDFFFSFGMVFLANIFKENMLLAH